MILFKHNSVKEMTQEIYDKLTDSLAIHTITCECGHVGFSRYGRYKRKVKNKCTKCTLEVQRICCPVCKVTHALLPYFLIPWSQIPLDTTVCIIQADTAGKIRTILDTHFHLKEDDIANVKRRFRKHWKERIISYAIPYDSRLTDNCLLAFGKQFMQIRCGKNGLKHFSTFDNLGPMISSL